MFIDPITKAEAIYQRIKKDICKGILRPGNRLIIQHLSAEYGISDIPVREALKKLTSEGYVETKPHFGSRVASISPKELEEVFVMREALEPLAAKLAVSHIAPAELAHLEELYRAVQAALQTHDAAAYTESHTNFHKFLIELCKNDLLTKTIFDLMNMETRMRNFFQFFPETMQNANKEHAQMIELIKDKDAEGLAALIYAHKKRAFDKVRKLMQDQDEGDLHH